MKRKPMSESTDSTVTPDTPQLAFDAWIEGPHDGVTGLLTMEDAFMAGFVAGARRQRERDARLMEECVTTYGFRSTSVNVNTAARLIREGTIE